MLRVQDIPVPTLKQWTNAYADARQEKVWQVTEKDCYIIFKGINSATINQEAGDATYKIYEQLLWNTLDNYATFVHSIRVLTPTAPYSGPPTWNHFPRAFNCTCFDYAKTFICSDVLTLRL
jgi:hypothetical protein